MMQRIDGGVKFAAMVAMALGFALSQAGYAQPAYVPTAAAVPDEVSLRGPIPCVGGEAAGYPCKDIELLAKMPLGELGGTTDGAGRGVIVNDLWGWRDPLTGREYALVGRSDGTAIVDVTHPQTPMFLGMLPSQAGTASWRDVKVMNDHLLVVADYAGDHGLQVFDLTQLRTLDSVPAVFSPTARYDVFQQAHNIVVNEATGFAYAVGAHEGTNACGGGLHMIDMRDPSRPQFAGCYSGDNYVHDAQCVVYQGPDAQYRGREICFTANGSRSQVSNAFSIVDVTSKTSPRGVARVSYPLEGYAHQGWLTEDQHFFILGDELDESIFGNRTRTLIFDVRDLDDPILAAEYFSENPATDHNLYVKGSEVFQANYESGLRVLDVRDPNRPEETAFFDTVPGRTTASMSGAWTAYPYHPSGIITVNSTNEGLFVLRPARGTVAGREDGEQPSDFEVEAAHPNPFTRQTQFTLHMAVAGVARAAVYDMLGRQVALLHDGMLAAAAHVFTLDGAELPAGNYVLRVTGASGTVTRTIVRLP